jgi:LacI family transcriptional regulator
MNCERARERAQERSQRSFVIGYQKMSISRISIKDIAREVGVSHQTVSRVINNHPDVSAETRQRVLEVIQLRGYRPNALARGLVNQFSRNLGVITNDLLKFGPASALAGMEEQADHLNYSLLIRLVPHGNEPATDKAIESLLSYQVEGLIWAGGAYGEDFDRFGEKSSSLDLPLVFIDAGDHLATPFVAIDNRAGGRLATSHLLEQGYRNIALITGDMHWWAARYRKQGWEETLNTAGFPPQPEQIGIGEWSAESGERVFHEILAQFPQVDAVFASNDQIALGVLKAAYDMNIRIPDQLGVIGFDNTPESAFFTPPLTTIHQPQHEVGCSAISLLDQAIRAKRDGVKPTIPEKQWLQPELVVRKSTLKQADSNR